MIIRIKRLLPFIIIAMTLPGCAGSGTASASHSRHIAFMETASFAEAPSPEPSRHPSDPIVEYPKPLAASAHPLSGDETELLYGAGGFFDFTLDYYDEPGALRFGGINFSPEDLLDRFQSGELYASHEVVEFLAQAEWPWREENLLGLSENTVFFDTWEKQIPLAAEPLTVCFVGLYPVNSEDYPGGVFSRETLLYEKGALYVFTSRGERGWRLLHRMDDREWHGRTEMQFAVNESGDCAWLVEQPPAGSGTGYESETIIWRNLVEGGIDLHYARYLMCDEYPIARDNPPVETYTQIVSVLYGMRYNWFPDGTRFICAPDRLTMQIEKAVRQYVYKDDTHTESDDTKAIGLVTAEFVCFGNRYQLISLRAEARDEASLFLSYTDIGGMSYKSGMPSFGYRVR